MAEEPDIVEGAIAGLARMVVGGKALAESLREVIAVVSRATGADGGTVTLLADRPLAVSHPDVFTPLGDHTRNGHGPGRQALDAGDLVVSVPGEHHATLARAAAGLGVGAILAVPLHVGDGPVGILELYAPSPATVDAHPHRLRALADQAAVVVANAQAYSQAATKADNLQRALLSRAAIDYAVGILMSGAHCNPDEAFRMLVRASQRQNRKVRDIAAEIVERAQSRSGTPNPATPA